MLYDGGLTAPEAPGMAYGPVVIKPTSRGKVMLRSPMPLAKPRVVCDFLTTEEDRASMRAGLRMALEIRSWKNSAMEVLNFNISATPPG